MEYKMIDAEAERARIMKDKARDLEHMATLAELDADQYRRSAELAPDNPTAKTRADDTARTAETQRAVADKAHKIAGTSRNDFAVDLATQVRNRVAPLEAQHLYHSIMLEHADDYGLDEQPLRWAIADFAAGLEAVRAFLQDYEKSLPKATDVADLTMDQQADLT